MKMFCPIRPAVRTTCLRVAYRRFRNNVNRARALDRLTRHHDNDLRVVIGNNDDNCNVEVEGDEQAAWDYVDSLRESGFDVVRVDNLTPVFADAA